MKNIKKLLLTLACFFLLGLSLYAQDEPVFEDHDIDPDEEIFEPIEQMPRFPGCEDEKESKRKSCADGKMLKYLYSNMKYPEIAKENGIEGTVAASFTIQEDGTLKDIKLIRDIGGGCGDALLEVLEKMNADGVKWIPGMQKGKPVAVKFQVPFKFKLSPESKAKSERLKKKRERKARKAKKDKG